MLEFEVVGVEAGDDDTSDEGPVGGVVVVVGGFGTLPAAAGDEDLRFGVVAETHVVCLVAGVAAVGRVGNVESDGPAALVEPQLVGGDPVPDRAFAGGEQVQDRGAGIARPVVCVRKRGGGNLEIAAVGLAEVTALGMGLKVVSLNHVVDVECVVSHNSLRWVAFAKPVEQ